MNNLKRILSLALASVMVLGMMVVGASAAEFADSDKINADYADAVATMNALGIINGFEDDTFRPEDTLTRAQMAMMLATIFRNGRTDFKFAVKENPSFTDVKSTDWYAGAVEYATNMGIINGRGNGIFDPASTVTATEAARMILNAMGYEQDEGDWQLNTVLQAEDAGLYRGMAEDDQLAGKLTREAAAQMLCNGVVSSPMADAEVVTETYYELTYKIGEGAAQKCPVKFESSTAAYLFASLNKDEGYEVVNVERKTTSAPKETLAIKYLSLDDATGVLYSVDKEDDGTYTVVLDSATGASFSKITTDYSKLLGRNVKVMFKETTGAIYGITATDTVVATIDGSEWKARVGANAAAKKEFTLADGGATYCTINNGSAGEVDIKNGSIVELINTNNDAKIEAIRITNKSVTKLGADPKVTTKNDKTTVAIAGNTYEADKVAGYENLKKDDIVLYVELNGVTTFEKAEMVTGVVTAIGPDTGKYYTVNGTKLFESKLTGASVLAADFKTEYNFYLDNGGNIVAMAKAGEAPADVKYAVTADFGYVTTGASTGIGGSAGTTTYQVQLIFTDGTTSDALELATYTTKDGTKYAAKETTGFETLETSDVATLKTSNKGKIVSYSVNKDGQYVLTEVGTHDLTGEITGGKAQFADSVAGVVGNKDTIFVVKVTGSAETTSDDKLYVYTGVANLPSVTETNATGLKGDALKDGTFVTLAYLEVKALDGSKAVETAYFIDNDTYVITAEGVTVQAIVDGEVKTLVVDEDSWAAVQAKGSGLKQVEYTDGKVTDISNEHGFTTANDVTTAEEFVVADGEYYYVATDAVIYKLENGKATLVDPADIASALADVENAHYEAEIKVGTGANADTILTMYVSVVAD